VPDHEVIVIAGDAAGKLFAQLARRGAGSRGDLVLGIAALAIGALSLAPGLTTDLFIGLGNCLGLERQTSVAPGARLVVLAAQHAPTVVSVESFGAVGSVNCSHWWLNDLPQTVARIRLPAELHDEVVFAIRDSGSLRVLGGRPVRLSDAAAQRWFRAAGSSLTARWREKGVLVHAYRYGSSGSRAAVELYVGRPALNPSGAAAPIREIAIRRLFFIGDQLFATEDYQRTSGAEERVDTEPPQLTFTNWSRSDTEQTVAYISTDSGQAWRRLSTDIGFEGINWVVQLLGDGLPTERIYAYTPH
jgi:hypothetical protein